MSNLYRESSKYFKLNPRSTKQIFFIISASCDYKIRSATLKTIFWCKQNFFYIHRNIGYLG